MNKFFRTSYPLLSVLFVMCLITGCSKDEELESTNEMYAHFTFEDNLVNLVNPGHKVEGVNTSFVESYDGSKALMIPAEDDAMLIIDGGTIDKREMTISFWAKDISYGHFFHAVNYTGNPSFLLWRREKSNLFQFICTQYHILYGGSLSYLSVEGQELSGWHMITLVSDFNITKKSETNTLLYIDGVFVDKAREEINRFSEQEGTSDVKNYNHCSKFIIGGKLQLSKIKSYNAPTIIIDNLRIYQNTRLSENQIRAIYNQERATQ
ncbi:MAG: hypothetical protein IJT98_04295 [Prevotella sp.]|nr:hypothetical protein [Prevotella sp.]